MCPLDRFPQHTDLRTGNVVVLSPVDDECCSVSRVSNPEVDSFLLGPSHFQRQGFHKKGGLGDISCPVLPGNGDYLLRDAASQWGRHTTKNTNRGALI